jgi:hypothetical protein
MERVRPTGPAPTMSTGTGRAGGGAETVENALRSKNRRGHMEAELQQISFTHSWDDYLITRTATHESSNGTNSKPHQPNDRIAAEVQ